MRHLVADDIIRVTTAEGRNLRIIGSIEDFMVDIDSNLSPALHTSCGVGEGLVRGDDIFLITSEFVVGDGIGSGNPLHSTISSPFLRYTESNRFTVKVVDRDW